MTTGENHVLMKKRYGNHDEALLVYSEGGIWRAIIKCDTCQRHYPIIQIDPSSDQSMMFVEAEMQMHGTNLDAKIDGWHDGLGFDEADLH